MLKYRLLFGTLMTVFFTAVVLLDGWLDGSITPSPTDDKSIQCTLFSILVAAIVVLALFELAALAAANGFNIFKLFGAVTTVALTTASYWAQVFILPYYLLLSFVCLFTLLALLPYQYARFGIPKALANCSVNYFCICYLGLLASFAVAVRTQIGLWQLLMFVYVVKVADIGAYTAGSLWGRRKFSPRISPGKTWEGMAGAVGSAVAVAILFAAIFGIMHWLMAALFGVAFAFIGQLGDLAESLIKRDAQQKDASTNVPGFGGILDIIDSPLVAAPFAYLFFKFAA